MSVIYKTYYSLKQNKDKKGVIFILICITVVMKIVDNIWERIKHELRKTEKF